MEIWNEDKKFVLQGDNTRKVTHDTIQSIQKLLASGLETYVMTINGPIYDTKVDSTQAQTKELEVLFETILAHILHS